MWKVFTRPTCASDFLLLRLTSIEIVAYKLHKESPKKNLAGIGEPMVLNWDMAGCLRKYLNFVEESDLENI
jgi:hypothetical protein